MIVSADVGGTFTDIVSVEDGQVRSLKLPTSNRPEQSVSSGISELVGSTPVGVFIHGTTVATNALLERKGARTLLITDAGFEDVVEIARQDRPSLYDPLDDRPIPLVDRSMRIGATGGDIGELPEADSVAIALVRGHVDGEREASIARDVRARMPYVPISLSSVVSGEFREYERISTTVLNAYVSPAVSSYLTAMDRELVGTGRVKSLSVMRSSGGLMDVAGASALPAAVLLSGPAGGVVAAAEFARLLGHRSVVSFDMGGTSTDVCLVRDGVIEVSHERSIDGHVCRLPSVGVHTVGAGGGSIAWIDAGGSLRVGPRSAGAEPGPAGYGLGGTEPTVTDANIVLGRISPDTVLGGRLRIDPDAANAVVGTLAVELGLSVVEAALGIVDIAEEVMAGAIRTVAVEAGIDLRDSSLVAFGGAGALHATSIARSLGMGSVVVPPFAGVLSALGLLLAPPRHDAQRAVFVRDDDLSPVINAAEELSTEVRTALARSGFHDPSVSVSVDVRYVGQAHEISLPWEGNDIESLGRRFGDSHMARNGFKRPDDPIEIVAVRAVAVGEPALSVDEIAMPEPESGRGETSADVVSGSGSTSARILDRSSLAVGAVVGGPAVVEDAGSTMFLDVGDIAKVHPSGAIEVTW